MIWKCFHIKVWNLNRNSYGSIRISMCANLLLFFVVQFFLFHVFANNWLVSNSLGSFFLVLSALLWSWIRNIGPNDREMLQSYLKAEKISVENGYRSAMEAMHLRIESIENSPNFNGWILNWKLVGQRFCSILYVAVRDKLLIKWCLLSRIKKKVITTTCYWNGATYYDGRVQ